MSSGRSPWMDRVRPRRGAVAALAVAVAVAVALVGGCSSGESDGKTQAASEAARAHGVYWYQMEAGAQAMEVDVLLLDRQRRQIGLYRIESEGRGSYRATLTLDGKPGSIGAENTFMEWADGSMGSQVRMFDDRGEFTVETRQLDGRYAMAFVEGEQRIDVLAFEDDAGAESAARFQSAMAMDSVGRMEADPRLVLFSAISDDAALPDLYAHRFQREHDQDHEHGKIVQEVHGTPICGAVLGTAGGVCIACIVGALAAGTITVGVGTVVVGAICGFACGWGLANLVDCVYSSVTAPTDADCRLRAANNYPWTAGSANGTTDRCVFTCDHGNCNGYCRGQDPMWTGSCQMGNVCQCAGPGAPPQFPAPPEN